VPAAELLACWWGKYSRILELREVFHVDYGMTVEEETYFVFPDSQWLMDLIPELWFPTLDIDRKAEKDACVCS
jgi:hypothetical protein